VSAILYYNVDILDGKSVKWLQAVGNILIKSFNVGHLALRDEMIGYSLFHLVNKVYFFLTRILVFQLLQISDIYNLHFSVETKLIFRNFAEMIEGYDKFQGRSYKS